MYGTKGSRDENQSRNKDPMPNEHLKLVVVIHTHVGLMAANR